MDDLDAFIDELLEEAREANAAKRKSRENPYVLHLIKVLLPHPKGLQRSIVLHEVRKLRKQAGLEIPEKFDDTVQRRFQDYAPDAAGFSKDESDGLFYWPNGKGPGSRWAVYPDKAREWLRRRGLST